MDLKTGIIIIGQFALLGAALWGALHEDRLLALEKAAADKLKAGVRRQARRRERARMEKINKKALYTPVKPPEKAAREKAA